VIKAVIFDVDGTLVDSNHLHVMSWQEAFREFGVEVPAEQFAKQIGKGGDQLVPGFLTKEQNAAFGERLSKRKDDLYRERYREQVRPFPRVRDLFERLHADEKRVAIATSGKCADLEQYIELLGVADLVDVMATAEDAAHTKPAPDIFAAALRKLENIPASNAIAVGDSVWDAKSAAGAGLRTIGLLCGGYTEAELRGAGCVAVYRDPADLLVQYAASPLTAS